MFQKLTLSKEFSNLIQVLNLPDKILSEYVSPDMNLSKEKQKIGDWMECFGGGGSKKAYHDPKMSFGLVLMIYSLNDSWIMLRNIGH